MVTALPHTTLGGWGRLAGEADTGAQAEAGSGQAVCRGFSFPRHCLACSARVLEWNVSLTEVLLSSPAPG